MIELSCENLHVRCIRLYVILISRTSFGVNPQSIVFLNVKELLARCRRHIWSLNNSDEIRTDNHLVRNRTLNHLAKLPKWYLPVRCIWQYVIIISRITFRVNPHPVVCVNFKELLVRSRQHSWSLSDSKEVRTHNHIVGKRTRKHIARLAKWVSCVVSTYIYSAFDCMVLLCRVRVPELIQILQLAWMSRNSLLEVSTISELQVTATRFEPTVT